jgi:hypothetical protein
MTPLPAEPGVAADASLPQALPAGHRCDNGPAIDLAGGAAPITAKLGSGERQGAATVARLPAWPGCSIIGGRGRRLGRCSGATSAGRAVLTGGPPSSLVQGDGRRGSQRHGPLGSALEAPGKRSRHRHRRALVR